MKWLEKENFNSIVLGFFWRHWVHIILESTTLMKHPETNTLKWLSSTLSLWCEGDRCYEWARKKRNTDVYKWNSPKIGQIFIINSQKNKLMNCMIRFITYVLAIFTGVHGYVSQLPYLWVHFTQTLRIPPEKVSCSGGPYLIFLHLFVVFPSNSFFIFFLPPEVPSPPISQCKHYLLVCPFYRPINWSLKLINYSHLWAQIHRCQAVKPLLLDALSFKVLFLLFKKAQDIEPSSINNETYLCLLYAR